MLFFLRKTNRRTVRMKQIGRKVTMIVSLSFFQTKSIQIPSPSAPEVSYLQFECYCRLKFLFRIISVPAIAVVILLRESNTKPFVDFCRKFDPRLK